MHHDEPTMDAQIRPDGQPPRFDGAAWVSQDGRHFWNGSGWQPVARPSFKPSGLFIGLALVVVVLAGYLVF